MPKSDYVTLQELYNELQDASLQPYFLTAFQQALGRGDFTGVPLDDAATINGENVQDQLIRITPALTKWRQALPITIKLMLLGQGQAVTFTREEAVKHYTEIARVKGAKARPAAPARKPAKAAPAPAAAKGGARKETSPGEPAQED